jgi:DNA-binding transcriptional regulator YiaG
MELSQKIKYVREKMDLSQEDLARALNVGISTVNRWENGKTKQSRMAKAHFDDYCKKNGISFDESEPR